MPTCSPGWQFWITGLFHWNGILEHILLVQNVDCACAVSSWCCHTISGPHQKRSPRTVHSRIIGPPWDHPRHCAGSETSHRCLHRSLSVRLFRSVLLSRNAVQFFPSLPSCNLCFYAGDTHFILTLDWLAQTVVPKDGKMDQPAVPKVQSVSTCI